MELENLAHFADTVLLLALIMVNAALIRHRQLYPDMVRPFRVPLVPLLPLLGILANIFLLSQLVVHPAPMIFAVVSIFVGFLGFLAWKGSQPEQDAMPGEPSRIALGRYAVREGGFRVLVPLSNPDNVEPLMEIASAVAAERDGEIVALRVSVVPEQVPAELDPKSIESERRLLEQAHSIGERHGVAVTSLVRVGRNPARAILETARERGCDLLVLGWKGYSTTSERIFGEIVDAVVSHARADLMLVKLTPEARFGRLLLPTAGGEHARRAEQYAASLGKFHDGALTVCSVLTDSNDTEARQAIEERLGEATERIDRNSAVRVDEKVIHSDSIERGIIEAAEGYDAIVLGATGRGHYPRILFGSVPEKIARESGKPVIVIKRHHPIEAWVRRVLGD